MQSVEEFMIENERKVQQSLVELIKELYRDGNEEQGIKKGPLSGIGYFKNVTPEVRVMADHNGEVFVAGKGGVRKVVHRGDVWLEDNFCFDGYTIEPHNYKSVSLLDIDIVPYLALGYSAGITLFNLKEKECKHVIVSVGKQFKTKSGFKNISVVTSPQKDYFLLASHSALGILRVPLDDFRRSDTVRVDFGGDYFIFRKDISEEVPVRLAVAERMIYASKGKDIYALSDIGADVCTKKMFSLPKNKNVTALCLDSRGAIYSGTSDGKIYKNNQLYFDVEDIFSEIMGLQEGTFEDKKGLFFTTRTNQSYSSALFTDGSSLITVSDMTYSKVIDFQLVCRGDSTGLYCLKKDTLLYINFMKKEKKENEEKVLEHTFYANALCVHGGKK